ncbi:MAG TPA: rhomboid family intramembrane serine protease [Bacteroidales bacterium]|nr:rhomboid family intramembrane serine protease [Bacteroidales bacterium]
MTIPIIIITAIVSIMSLNNRTLMEKLQFNPYNTYHKKQWYRLITHAFVHADYMHLFINMLVFLSFGIAVEKMFGELKLIGIISNPTFHFVTLYLGGTIIASLTTLKKHKDNYYYNSVGASGAVSAVVFTSIFFQPLSNLYLMGIIPIPAIIFGVFYLIYSHYMSRKSTDNINHDAHFIGAVFGFIYPLLIDPKLFKIFLNQLGLWVN